MKNEDPPHNSSVIEEADSTIRYRRAISNLLVEDDEEWLRGWLSKKSRPWLNTFCKNEGIVIGRKKKTDLIDVIIHPKDTDYKKSRSSHHFKRGTGVKGRDGSTRHGAVNTYGRHHGPEITEEEIVQRNQLLKIDPAKCFWCKRVDRQCWDHAHPCCNTERREYSFENALNMVPSCTGCNGTKGGKLLVKWVESLENWSAEEKVTYIKWLNGNKNKLLITDPEDLDYMERFFKVSNSIHHDWEYRISKKMDCLDPEKLLAQLTTSQEELRARTAEVERLKVEVECLKAEVECLKASKG